MDHKLKSISSWCKPIIEGGSKTWFFACFGAAGSFLAAILFGELLLAVSKTNPPTGSKAPSHAIVLLIDCSGSMDGEKLSEVKSAASSFAARQDLFTNRLGVVGFGSQVHVEAQLGDDLNNLRQGINRMADGGKTQMDEAIATATEQLRGYLADSKNQGFVASILLFTDGMPQSRNSAVTMALKARSRDIRILAVATGDADVDYLAKVTGNKDLVFFARSGQFEEAFQKAERMIFGGQLVESSHSGEYHFTGALFRIGGWTAFLGLGVALALIIAQNHYLKRQLLSFREAKIGILGGGIAGFAAGVLGQVFYDPSTGIFLMLLPGVMSSGVVAGLCMGYVGKQLYRGPSLKEALAFGMLGGTLGGLAFGIVSVVLGHALAAIVLLGAGLYGLFQRKEPKYRIAALAVLALAAIELFLTPALGDSIRSFTARMAGWTVLGLILGLGMCWILPNLERSRALAGGALGGAGGAVVFVIFASALGDLAGRLLGAAVLGFFIGLMIAIVETLSTKLYLHVTSATTNPRRVNLGREAIVIGSSKNAHIRLAAKDGIPDIAAKVYAEGPRIVIDRFGWTADMKSTTSKKRVMMVGEKHEIGGLSVEVRESSGLAMT